MQLRYIFYVIALLYVPSIVWGQQSSSKVDPAGYVLKYDAAFDGIGPKVYVLPAPRSRAELLVDEYKGIALFQDSVDKKIAFQNLVSSFVTFSPDSVISEIRANLSDHAEEWPTDLQAYAPTPQQRSLLANDLAQSALQEMKTKEAVALLQLALHRGMPPQEASMRFNLIDVLIFDRQYTMADSLIESAYQIALDKKNLKIQAVAQLKKAQLHLTEHSYHLAENTIIRKAIPLFNKAKDYQGKMEAWIELAYIYLEQQKYTEAQWFLIQAKDIASARKMPSHLAEINYLLGLAKYRQQNYRVARMELTEALRLSPNAVNSAQQLAIHEKLGQMAMIQNDIAEAEKQLTAYLKLRRKLFGK